MGRHKSGGILLALGPSRREPSGPEGDFEDDDPLGVRESDVDEDPSHARRPRDAQALLGSIDRDLSELRMAIAEMES